MKVFFVGAGPGDPELLTVKAERLLHATRCCIYAGSLVNPEILELLPPDAERRDSAGMSLDEILEVIEGARRKNVDVLRLHTGEPSIYGAIGEQMDALDQRDIDYEIVPGISAFQATAARLRVELTAPEVSQAVVLSRIAGKTPVPATQELERLAPSLATLCLFLSVGKIEEVARILSPHYGEDCPAAVVFHATWPDEKIVRGQLGEIAAKVRENEISRTAMILIGRALARPLQHVSRLYDKGIYPWIPAGRCLVSLAIVTLSEHGQIVAGELARELGGGDLYVHQQARPFSDARSFNSVIELTRGHLPPIPPA